MLVTKELVTKGAAILGSAGAGGTGLYYGGSYMSGLSKNAAAFLDHTEKDSENYYTFDVQKQDGDGEWMDVAASTNDIDFNHKNPFEVKITASSMSNVGIDNAEEEEQEVSSQDAVSCTFRFEVEGDYGNKTIKQDY